VKLAVVGAGWAGLAAAVEAMDLGADVTLFEATRTPGGRARALPATRPDGVPLRLDNGQHILIGAYRYTLGLMQRLGIEPEQVLLGTPLSLPYPDGGGLQTPAWAARWPAPLDAVAAILTASGWSWGERLALVRASLAWQRSGFVCPPSLTVGELCRALPARAMDELIEPLCVSALNLPAAQASAQVFLAVMRDALFGQGFGRWSASALLLPRDDLGALLPDAACRHLGARVRLGTRVTDLQDTESGWTLAGDGWSEDFDRVIWATAASHAASTIGAATGESASSTARRDWAAQTRQLDFTAITTVYAWAPDARLPAPMLALRNSPDAPAQFAFDRGQLRPDDPSAQGVLAFVVSASEGERDELQQRVLAQAGQQLALPNLQAIRTVVEKRATFACTPALKRPATAIAPGLWAAGDYIDGPYPATIEGAVRSGLAAVALVG
jgi:squalene-associated FAD-dependent desaturase